MEEMVGAYALGALDPDEAPTFEQHLVGCEVCRRALSEYDEVLAGLPEAVSADSPIRLHPALKRRVLRSVERPIGIRSRWRSWLPAAAAACLILLLLSVVINIQLAASLAHQRTVQTELVGKITHDQATVFDVVDSSATTKRVLRSPADTGPSAPYGKVFSRSDSADIVAMVNRLPQPPAGQTYHLYVERADGRITAAGTLPVDAEGFSYLVYRGDQAGPTFKHIEVRLGTQTILAWDGSR